MKVSLVTIGDEILIGQIIDTNSAWMAQRFNEIGLQVDKIYSIPDSEEAILRTLERASMVTDIVVITGGLGPTNDDITKSTLLKYFNDTLVRNEEILDNIKHLFYSRGRKIINSLNEGQADLPSKCKVLMNPIGTASGMWFTENKKDFIFMPGVPSEMKEIMNTHVIPGLQVKFNPGYFIHRTILTQGMPESILSEKLADWENSLSPELKLAYLPSETRVRLRLSAKGENHSYIESLIEDAVQKLYLIIPNHIYGENKDSIENRLGLLLTRKNLTLSTTESCTGGYLSHLITSIPGSSKYFKGGVLAYDVRIKMEVLGISPKTLKNYGVVSAEVVKEMAQSVQKIMGTDYALSTSGILGPSGGSKDVPVGVIWAGIASPYGVKAIKYQFGSDRIWNMRRVSTTLMLDLIHDLESAYKKTE
jgi:nicotinamide-nucleotide amidase